MDREPRQSSRINSRTVIIGSGLAIAALLVAAPRNNTSPVPRSPDELTTCVPNGTQTYTFKTDEGMDQAVEKIQGPTAKGDVCHTEAVNDVQVKVGFDSHGNGLLPQPGPVVIPMREMPIADDPTPSITRP